MTRRDLALSLLQDAGPRGVETAEFLRAGVGSRYSARIMELRRAGWRITSERVREGSWKYVLDVEVSGGSQPGITQPSAGAEELAVAASVDPADLSVDKGRALDSTALKLFESAA